MKEPNSTRVVIFGDTYQLKGAASPGHLQQVAELVDAKMKEIAARNTKLDHMKTAVLAAINIADELLRIRRREDEAEAALRSKDAEIAELKAALDQAQQEIDALYALLDEQSAPGGAPKVIRPDRTGSGG